MERNERRPLNAASLFYTPLGGCSRRTTPNQKAYSKSNGVCFARVLVQNVRQRLEKLTDIPQQMLQAARVHMH